MATLFSQNWCITSKTTAFVLQIQSSGLNPRLEMDKSKSMFSGISSHVNSTKHTNSKSTHISQNMTCICSNRVVPVPRSSCRWRQLARRVWKTWLSLIPGLFRTYLAPAMPYRHRPSSTLLFLVAALWELIDAQLDVQVYTLQQVYLDNLLITRMRAPFSSFNLVISAFNESIAWNAKWEMH
jgi:hypothetical protein